MKVIETIKAVRKELEGVRKAKKTVALVPTMGALHAGHLALIQQARSVSKYVAVSIFVNPTQFAPGEDFEKYSRPIKADLEKCRQAKVDLVFTPAKSELYAPDFVTYVCQERLTERLCGLSRPTHFRGVLTVVLKLFNIFQPDAAVFGLKDYQQYICVRKMAQDFHSQTKVVGVNTVRESDGLALSSRNQYLDPIARKNATCLYRALLTIKSSAKRGDKRAASLIRKGRELIEETPQTIVDYLTIVDKDTLEEVNTVNKGAVAMGAIYIAGTRLIDNLAL